MSMKNLRTGIAAATGGAVLLAGLLVGASLAFAQESDEPPEESTLERIFGIVEDAVADSDATSTAAESLDEITADLLADIEPLVDQIRDRVLIAVDDAVAAELLTDEQAAALKERIAAFELPDELPLWGHGLRFGAEDFDFDGDCFRFRFGPEGTTAEGDCPEFPEGFPFGPEGFRFDGRPFEFFGDELDGFLEDLEFDIDGLMERLDSGMNLDEALQDLDVDLEQLLSDARDKALAGIDELVEDEELSEERADRIREMLEGIDLSGAFPFGLEDFDLEGFDFGDLGDFHFEGFGGPHGHGFKFFFGDDSGGEDVNAGAAWLDT